MMRKSTCRACGRPILWIGTPAGKYMPCDPESLAFWQRKDGPYKIVTPGGEVVSADLDGLPGAESGEGYISHFATCPAADQFRGR